jgi:hypothetical protein
VRLERENDNVHLADCVRVVGGFCVYLKVADLAADAHAVFLHCVQVCAACD